MIDTAGPWTLQEVTVMSVTRGEETKQKRVLGLLDRFRFDLKLLLKCWVVAK